MLHLIASGILTASIWLKDSDVLYIKGRHCQVLVHLLHRLARLTLFLTIKMFVRHFSADRLPPTWLSNQGALLGASDPRSPTLAGALPDDPTVGGHGNSCGVADHAGVCCDTV